MPWSEMETPFYAAYLGMLMEDVNSQLPMMRLRTLNYLFIMLSDVFKDFFNLTNKLHDGIKSKPLSDFQLLFLFFCF